MKPEKRNLIIVAILFFLLGLLTSYLYLQNHLSSESKAIPNRLYFPEVHSLFSSASERIHIVMFTMRHYEDYGDSSAETLLSDLAEAKERGVDVKVILEGGEDFLGEEFAEDQKSACRLLQGSGIEVMFDPEGVDTHAKLLIIDDTVVLGSTNWNYYAIDENNEASARIDSAGFVAAYDNYFWNLWRRSSPANCEPAEETIATISEILSDRDFYDGRNLIVAGKVSGLKLSTSKSGNDYATFSLAESGQELKVFIFGHPEINDGDTVNVRGKYQKEKYISGYKYYDEIEAEDIEKT